MQVIVGFVLLILSVVGSYLALGGNLILLFQPFELTLIFGAGAAAYILGNSRNVTQRSVDALRQTFRGSKYRPSDYEELLIAQFEIYRLLKAKGPLAIEAHVEDPEESSIFNEYPSLVSNAEALHMLVDYLRLIIMGTNSPYEIENLIDAEIEVHRKENSEVIHSLTVFGESFPALGIVAAVLGVIKAMSAITEPPEILGGLIAAALVGTFLGIILSYGIFSPLAGLVKQIKEEEETYLFCIKEGLLAYLRGYSPIVCIEFARKTLLPHNRPSFEEMEEIINDLPPLKKS